MAESNLKEMMIDDINEDADEENQIIDSQPKLKWYLIDTDRTFCKVWNFLITIVTIYTLFVTPFLLVFQEVYEFCLDEKGANVVCWDESAVQSTKYENKTLKNIELAIDIIYFIEIILNFVKKTRAHKELLTIAYNYLTFYFIFDVVATIPELFMSEGQEWYGLKAFRIVHVDRLTQPLYLLFGCALQKYSKKRQNDLTGFAGLILYVIYTSHIMACAWLYLGASKDCKNIDSDERIEGCT